MGHSPLADARRRSRIAAVTLGLVALVVARPAAALARPGLGGGLAERTQAGSLAASADPRATEAIPPPRDGFVWSPGYWRLHEGRYVYREGRYVAVPTAARPPGRLRRLPLRRR